MSKIKLEDASLKKLAWLMGVAKTGSAEEDRALAALVDRVRQVPLWLVSIVDKQLMGEPDIGFAIVAAATEEEALKSAKDTLDMLIYRDHRRVHARARRLDQGRFYRTNALVRSPVVQDVTTDHL